MQAPRMAAGRAVGAAVALWLALAVWLGAAPAEAQAVSLAVVGDGQHLWVVQEVSRETVLVLHRGPDDPPGVVHEVERLRGRVRPGAVAAHDGRLWLAYESGAVQVIVAERSPLDGRWVYREGRRAPLPTGGQVRALAVNDAGAWALLRVETREALRAIDAPVAEPRPRPEDADAAAARREAVRRLALGLPPRPAQREAAPEPEADEPVTEEADDGAAADDGAGVVDGAAADGGGGRPNDDGEAVADEPAREAVPDEASVGEPGGGVDAVPEVEAVSEPLRVDRLMRLEPGGWQRVPLPADWVHGSPAWLVALDEPGEPTLRLVAAPRRGPTAARVYTPVMPTGEAADAAPEAGDVAWTAERYPLPSDPAVAITVAGQLVVGSVDRRTDGITLELTILRPQGARPLGALTIPQPGIRAWGAAPYRLTTALVVETRALAGEASPTAPPGTNTALAPEATPTPATAAPRRALWWARIDLRGQVLGEPVPLEPPADDPLADAAGYIVMVVVLVVAVLIILFFFRRRDLPGQQLQLPEDLVLADVPPRMVAGLIDLVPAVLIAMQVFNLGFEALLQRWPGAAQATSWTAIAPGALAIAIFVGHTLLAELLFARSLGKAIVGLRVTTLQGTRPRLWQLLLRNLLKSFDLVAWLLLVLPLLSPHRQRLGDLVARTIVVAKAPPANAQKDKDDTTPDDEG